MYILAVNGSEDIVFLPNCNHSIITSVSALLQLQRAWGRGSVHAIAFSFFRVFNFTHHQNHFMDHCMSWI